MSSFLKRHSQQEEPESSGDNEELYERLFPKIGRDFVYKEDIYPILDILIRLIDPLGVFPIDIRNDANARTKAKEYKDLLKSGKDGSEIYTDLINLDD